MEEGEEVWISLLVRRGKMAALLKFALVPFVIGIAYGLPCNHGCNSNCGNTGIVGALIDLPRKVAGTFLDVGEQVVGDGFGGCGSNSGSNNNNYGQGLDNTPLNPLNLGYNRNFFNRYDPSLLPGPAIIPATGSCGSAVGSMNYIGAGFGSAPSAPIQTPIVVQPVVAQPVVAQPVVAQPAIAQPVVAQPAVAQPVVAQPVVNPLPPANTMATSTAAVESVATATTQPAYNVVAPVSHPAAAALSSSHAMSSSSAGARNYGCGQPATGAGTASASASASATSSSG